MKVACRNCCECCRLVYRCSGPTSLWIVAGTCPKFYEKNTFFCVYTIVHKPVCAECAQLCTHRCVQKKHASKYAFWVKNSVHKCVYTVCTQMCTNVCFCAKIPKKCVARASLHIFEKVYRKWGGKSVSHFVYFFELGTGDTDFSVFLVKTQIFAHLCTRVYTVLHTRVFFSKNVLISAWWNIYDKNRCKLQVWKTPKCTFVHTWQIGVFSVF